MKSTKSVCKQYCGLGFQRDNARKLTKNNENSLLMWDDTTMVNLQRVATSGMTVKDLQLAMAAYLLTNYTPFPSQYSIAQTGNRGECVVCEQFNFKRFDWHWSIFLLFLPLFLRLGLRLIIHIFIIFDGPHLFFLPIFWKRIAREKVALVHEIFLFEFFN